MISIDARPWRPAAAVMLFACLAAPPAPWMSAARAQRPVAEQFEAELTKQEGIYRSRGKDVPGGYVTDRGLARYGEHLHTGFERELASLGAHERWLDIGAGNGQAILDYYSPAHGKGADPARKARAVAISIEDRRTETWRRQAATLERDRIRYLFGKRLREYTLRELGRFRMITDVYGGFSYTEELSLFMKRVLDLLDLDGSFYTLVQSVHLEDGSDPPTTYYLTKIADAAGNDVKVCSWLKRAACVKVSCESRSDWHTPTELIHVRKVCDEVSLPALLPVHYEAGNPPERWFRLKGR